MELLRRYSKRSDLQSRIAELLKLPPDNRSSPPPRQPRTRARRLSAEQEDELCERYQSGETVLALAGAYGISRQTVSAILERHGIKRRYNILTDDEIAKAREMYEQGWSLARVANHLGVAAKTVQSALRAAGVAMRPVGTNQWR